MKVGTDILIFMKRKKWLWLMIVVPIGASFFYYYNHTSTPSAVTPQIKQRIPTQTSTASSTNTMKITSVEPFKFGESCKDITCPELGARNSKIFLKGPVVVTGTYSYINSAIGFAGFCMEEFDRGFLGSLPYDLSNQHIRMFCFRNATFADNKLGKERKTVSVTIDNFELNSYPSEVMNWADLVDVKF